MTNNTLTVEGTEELGISRQRETALQEVQAQVYMARQYPRSEASAYQGLIRTCGRYAFAVDAEYSFPRGGRPITGGTVHLAREAKRHWGNIASGVRILGEDDEKVVAEAWAWDFQSNTRQSREFICRKLIQRKQDDGETKWVKPNERDLRELIMNIGARNERECIFQLIPSDFIADARAEAQKTIASKIKEDPDRARKAALSKFEELGITAEMLEGYLGKAIKNATQKDIAQLRSVYSSIAQGEAKWADYAASSEPARGDISVDDLEPSKNPNRGHEDSMPKAEGAESLHVGSFTDAEKMELWQWLEPQGINTPEMFAQFLKYFEGTKEELMSKARAYNQNQQQPEEPEAAKNEPPKRRRGRPPKQQRPEQAGIYPD